MLRYSTKVIASISLFLLFFAVSGYGPSVYAKMQVLEDEYLSEVEGEAGVTMGLNVTVRVVADRLRLSNPAGEYIQASPFYIDNGSGGNISINAVTTQDVGSSGGRTWLRMSTPHIEGMRVYAPSLTVSSSTGTYTVGNLSILGIYMGSNVTSVTPNYIIGNAPYWRIGSHATSTQRGIDLYAEDATYIDNVLWEYSASRNVRVNGIYMYGANTNIASGTPSGWGTLTGDMIIGYNGTSTDYATIDVGSGGEHGTILSLYMPNYGSMRIRSFEMNGQNFGPIAQDNQNFYTLRLTIRNLNSAGY